MGIAVRPCDSVPPYQAVMKVPAAIAIVPAVTRGSG